MRKRRICRVIAVFLAVAFVCPGVLVFADTHEPPTVEKVGAVYLYNPENDKVIYEHRSNEKMYPAASVKIMTAVVAYEKLRDRMQEKINITKDMVSGVVGNHIAIEAGEKILVRDLFYALLLKGANDAAFVLSNVACGNVDNFVLEMNRRAKELGMTDTVYTNPTGMHDDKMTTTAKDTAAVALLFNSYPELMEMSSVSKHVIEPTDDCLERNIYNRNAFVSKLNSLGTIEYYYKYAKGINFGSTEEGGDSFVTIAERDGLSYLCVILGGEEDEDEHIYAFDAARTLCDYALDGYGYVVVLKKDRLVYDMPVELSEQTDKVMLVPAEEIKAYLPYDIDPEKDLTYSYTLHSELLTAPVAEGQPAGFISVYYGDELLGTVSLITGNEVKLSGFLSGLNAIKSFTQSKFFICTVIALIVVTVSFVLINSVIRQRKTRRNSRFSHRGRGR